MADLWTDDAVRFGPDTPADVGKPAIRERNERSTARLDQGVDVRSGNQRLDDLGWRGRQVALLHRFVCRIAGWRADARSWHGARGAQEAPERELESLPRDGDPRMITRHFLLSLNSFSLLRLALTAFWDSPSLCPTPVDLVSRSRPQQPIARQLRSNRPLSCALSVPPGQRPHQGRRAPRLVDRVDARAVSQ